MTKHILLSSVGTWNPEKKREKTTYSLKEQNVDHYFSAFGLRDLLQDRPDEIWFLLTKKAKDTQWETIKNEANGLNIKVKAIDLSAEIDDTHKFLETVASQIPEGCRLTLDLTQGLRHHAFLLYALTQYLTTFRNVEISGAWYCNIFVEEKSKPFIDLKPVLDLTDWFHAISVYQRFGFTNDISDLVQKSAKTIREQEKDLRKKAGKDPELNAQASEIGRGAREFEKYKNALDEYALHFGNGLPLELGYSSKNLNDIIRSFSNSNQGKALPLSQELIDLVILEAKKWAMKIENEKGKLSLSREELARQAKIIDRYFEVGFYALALGMLREWIISWLLLQKGKEINWLARDCREPEARRLNGLYKSVSNENLNFKFSEDLKDFVTNWDRVVQLRNAFHHHGMNRAITNPENALTKIRQFWIRLKQGDLLPPVAGGDNGTLLICPIGNSPGVLYSAILNLETLPEDVLVICSEQTRQSVHRALEQAGFTGDHEIIEMKNPFTGYDEFSDILKKTESLIFRSKSILANLTGGTTLMGVLIGEILNNAKYKLQREAKKFVLIDERTPQEQRDNPWVKSKIHYLGKERTIEKDS